MLNHHYLHFLPKTTIVPLQLASTHPFQVWVVALTLPLPHLKVPSTLTLKEFFNKKFLEMKREPRATDPFELKYSSYYPLST